MKFSLKTIACLSAVAITTVAASTYAAEPKASTLLYISPNEYSHSLLLLTPYSDGYWFEQGPLVEPIAFEALKAKDSNLAMCNGSETADTIIRVKPYLFYNPWPAIYYSRLVATVYSAGGEALGVYIGEAQQSGPGPAILEMTAESDISKAYALAMQDLMTKLQIKPMSERKKVETILPCGIIGSQLESRYNFY
jgi:hypothetical protein